MKMNSMKKMLSVMGVLVLIAVMALNMAGCSSEPPAKAETKPAAEVPVSTNADGVTVIGEGQKVFTFVAVDLEGKETQFEVHTDAKYVGEALVAYGLIDGEDGDYGMYVKSVNGIPLDWDTDGKYWSFLIGGEYAMTGADMTEIEEGVVYTFTPAE